MKPSVRHFEHTDDGTYIVHYGTIHNDKKKPYVNMTIEEIQKLYNSKKYFNNEKVSEET